MKKTIVVFLLVSIVRISFGQAEVYSILANKPIVSVLYQEQSILNAESTIVVDEKTNTTYITNYEKGGKGNRFVVTRNVAFKNKDNLKFKIQRILQTGSRLNVDTDMPFASDEISKMAFDNYLTFVKKNINIKLYEANSFTKTELGIIDLSDADLPSLNPQSVLSGVLLTEKSTNSKDWTDSISVKDGHYMNHYYLADESKQLYKLEGYFVPKKKISKPTPSEPDINTLQPGQSIEAETEILATKYTATITLSEKYPNLIQYLELENYSSIILNIMGDLLPQQLKTKIRVMNKISE